MAAPTLSNFTAELRTRNIARPNLYYVELLPPPIFKSTDTGLVSMWCRAAQTPQSNILTQDDYIENGVRRKYAYNQDYQNLVLEFYVDQGYNIKRFFDQWKNYIAPQRRNFGYPKDYTSDKFNLYLINQKGEPTYLYEYTNIFPKTIQSIDLSHTVDATVVALSVEFVFEEVYWSSMVHGLVDFSSRPNNVGSLSNDNNGINTKNPEIKQSSMEDSSFAGRGANGTRWTDSTNGITGVKDFSWSDIF